MTIKTFAPSLCSNTIKTFACELNIGLAPSANFPDAPATITADFILATIGRACRVLDFSIATLEYRQFLSATEPTLAIKLKVETYGAFGLRDLLEIVADHTYQDAIAVLHCDPVEHAARYRAGELDGELIGTFAADWGTFNPEYFERFAGVPCRATGGHLPGSGVQAHSADPYYARHGLVMICHEANGRRLWEALAHGHHVITGARHDAVRAAAVGLLTGA